MTKRRAKPKSPEAIAAERAARLAAARARDFGAVGLQTGASTLPANDMVQVTREGRKTVQAARRADVFDALREGMAAGAYDAARRLEQDIRIRMDEQGRNLAEPKVDATPTAAGHMDARVIAGEKVDKVLGRIGARDAMLLNLLIQPTLGRAWRAIVRDVTKEDHPMAQAAAVRSACSNLRLAYDAIDGRLTYRTPLSHWVA